jgi:hypothetical protein
MSTIDDLLNWSSNFRQSRKAIPRGRPLWAYKVTDAELHDLQTLLADLSANQDIRSLIYLYEDPYAEVFVVFASTWLQRNSAGRPKWEPVLDAINAKGMDQAVKMSLVEKGLRKWGLSVYSTDTSSRYLDSLACQGGFPRSDLLQQSASHIMDYFVAVLKRYERYQHFDTLDSLAVDSLSVLPITLQQTAFATLVTQLIERLLEWKAHYDLGAYKDAVKVLDTENPHWRQELPFLVLDEEAQTLINKLLKRASQLKRRELNPIRIKRQLVSVDDDYRLTAEIYIAREIHPADLRRQLGSETLPTSFFISTNTSDNNRVRTASLTLTSGANSGWKVTTYSTQVKNAVAAGELGFSLDSDGRQLLVGTYYRGEALEDDIPWVFEASGSLISYIGQGSLKTNRDRLVVVSARVPTPLTPVSTAKRLGGLISTPLQVFEVTGEVAVEGLSGQYRISCNSGTSEEISVQIDTVPYQELNAKRPIYLGAPEVSFLNSGVLTAVEKSELFWYQRGSKTLKPLHADGVLGSGIIVWRRAQTVLWEKPVIILPPRFEYRLIHIEDTHFNLLLLNALRPKLGMCAGFENWFSTPPRLEATELRADLEPKDTAAELFSITLMWDDNPDTECELEIPISFNAATLVDRKGSVYQELKVGGLTVSELSNLRVRIRTEVDIDSVQVVAHLFGKPNRDGQQFALLKHQIQIVVDCKQGLSVLRGSDLSDVTARLFSLSDELDSSVELQFYSGGVRIPSTLPRIKRFKHDLNFTNESCTVLLRATPALLSVESPKLYLSPIWDFDRDPIEIATEDESANVWHFKLPALGDIEYGSWLIWGEPEMSVHPRIRHYPVPAKQRDPQSMGALGAQLLQALNQDETQVKTYEETLIPGSLSYRVKYLDPNNKDSMAALNKSVRNMGFEIDHKGWEYIDGVMKRIESIEPLALFAMTALQRNPGALATLLFRDRKHFHRAWDLAERLGVSWYLIPIPIWVSVLRKYFEKYQLQAEPLREMGEEVYWEMVYKPFTEFEAKGPYFNYLVDIATGRPCFEPVDIWDDDDLKKNDLDDQTVGALFRRERTALFDRHEEGLLSRVGTKGDTHYFIPAAEENLPTLHGLPPELYGFIKYTIAQGGGYDTKQDAWTLTMRLPLQVGLLVSGFYKRPHKPRFMLHLRNAITQLDTFDREWFQQAMIVSHMAYSILEIEHPNTRFMERT